MITSIAVKPMLLLVATLLALSGQLTAQTKIYIDPGHGGTDPGAVNAGQGTKEAVQVLLTAHELRKFLEADTADPQGGGEWDVRMSRSTDVFISLSARSADANFWGADRFISIHQNAFNQSANGTETFSISNSGDGAKLRDLVQAEAIKAWGLANRGEKTANFSVLRNTAMPAVLTEMGFIDSPKDHPFCASAEECRTYAQHLMFALQQHYGMDAFLPGSDEPVDMIIDNKDATFTEKGQWYDSSSEPFWGTESRWAGVFGGNTQNEAVFRPVLPRAGRYEVYAWWVAGSNRSPGAGYVVHSLDGPEQVRRDQRVNGGQWNLLGTFGFEAGTDGHVVLSSQNSQVSEVEPRRTIISADAIRFVWVEELPVAGAPNETEVIVDNTDPGFTVPSGEWFTGSYGSQYLGTNYHARETEAIADAASWSVKLPKAGEWEVFARWTTGSNRSTEAPFVVQHRQGTTVKRVNQKLRGGEWVSLGTYGFDAGVSERVLLSCWSNSKGVVIADAVRFVKR